MKGYKKNRIVFSFIALVIGLILLFWPGASLTIMCKCIAAFLAAGGVVEIILYLRDHESVFKSMQLILGVIMVIVGVIVYRKPEGLVSLIPTVIGALVVMSGVVNLGEALTLSRQKYTKWWTSLLWAALTIGLGAILITRAFGITAMITRVAGGFVVFDAVTNLLIVKNIDSKEKEAKQGAEAIDVDGEYVEDDH